LIDMKARYVPKVTVAPSSARFSRILAIRASNSSDVEDTWTIASASSSTRVFFPHSSAPSIAASAYAGLRAEPVEPRDEDEPASAVYAAEGGVAAGHPLAPRGRPAVAPRPEPLHTRPSSGEHNRNIGTHQRFSAHASV
jgi:hypothetical protein